MSPRRHSWPALVVALAACTLLSGCFGSSAPQPTASHHRRHHHPTSPSSSPTTAPTSSGPTSAPPAPASVLTFSPTTGLKHPDCEKLSPGADPAEFLYYPVTIQASTPVHIDTIGTQNGAGVVNAGAWVSQTNTSLDTGTTPWPPPSLIAQDPNLHWKQRMPATGATLAVGLTYEVFIHLKVDPTVGTTKIKGVVVTYHDSSGSQVDTWPTKTTFSMSCP